MSLIDSSIKFVGINPDFPTAERKSAQNNAAQEVVTMQDITDTVLSVSPTPPDPAPLAFANAATVGALSFNPVYNNGTSGVGATLTATQNGVLRDTSTAGKIDLTYTPVAGDIILVKNQTGGISNGLYTITNPGSISTTYVLTRVSNFDESTELYPLQINVLSGSSNGLKYFIQTTANPNIGVSNLIFSLSNLQQSVSQIAFIDTVIDTPLSNIVYASGTAFPTIPGSGATLTATINGALGTYYGLTANTNSTIAGSFTRVLLINQTNPAHNGDYQVINAGSGSTRWQLRRIQTSSSGFDRYTRYFVVSNAGSSKTGKVYFTAPNSPALTNATIGTAPINIFEYGGSGVQVGSTPITSGTVGRLIFQGSGDVVQQDSNLFWDNTNKRLGIGATPNTSTRLDVRAQGALSTDVAFRVRNSADTSDIFSLRGNGEIYIPSASSGNQTGMFISGTTTPILKYSGVSQETVSFGFGNSFTNGTLYNTIIGSSCIAGASAQFASVFGWNSIVNSSSGIAIGNRAKTSGTNSIVIGTTNGNTYYSGTRSIHLGTKGNAGNELLADDVFMTYFNSDSSSTLTRANGSFGLLGQGAYILANGTGANGLTTFMGTGGNTFVVRNHASLPSTNIVDSFQQYSNDIVPGNAAPHFRTENGDVIRLYKQTLPAVPVLTDVIALLTNLGLI